MDAERIIAETKHIRIIERKPSTKAGKSMFCKYRTYQYPDGTNFFRVKKRFRQHFKKLN